MSNRPLFVISLDFELFWGMFDKTTLEKYRQNIRGVHVAIPEILALFKHHNIHATWATVGLLMSENKNELLAQLPPIALQPTYKDMSASSYDHIKRTTLGENAEDDPHHYGSGLVKKIIATPNQELASHTFSHYYVQDGGENGSAIFAADCDAFKKVSQKFNTPITSLVFPRNQITDTALATLKEFGFTAYRGTPHHFLYTGKKESEQTSPLLRILRLIDAYCNITGHHTYALRAVSGTHEYLKNVAASRFFRPYSSSLRVLEKVRIARIKNSMTYAAKHNEVFHLWWHPHNFGINRKENLRALTEILEHYEILKEKYSMESVTMREVATRANG